MNLLKTLHISARKILISVCFPLFFPLLLSAQKEGLNAIKTDNLKAYMTFFASDEMKGRETATDANDAAALFIKSNLIRLGLKGIPGNGSYYQDIPLQRSEIKNKLTVNGGNISFSTDSVIVLAPSANPEVSGKIVFAGYGFEDEKTGYSDIRDIDLKDKIVLVMTGTPGKNKDPKESSTVFNNKLEAPKLNRMFGKGPKAIFLVYNPASKYGDPYRSGMVDMIGGARTLSFEGKKSNTLPIQMGFITQFTANRLLSVSGHNLKQLQDSIDETGKPFSFEIENLTATAISAVSQTQIKARNVIGIVEGSDPLLRNECVIYTAHFDHTGMNGKGQAFNGADDNASGSMTLLEVANAFMNLKKKPGRTIVFAWVNGEEKGLMGSRYYADNPIIPLKNTLLDINLDMVGRSRMPSDTGKLFGYNLTVTLPGEIEVYPSLGNSSGIDKMLAESAGKAGIKIIDKGKDLQFGGSDHESFINKGVPAIMFHSGIHADLHTINDDLEKIDFDKMEKTAKMVFLLGYKVANRKIKASDAER